MLIPIWGAGSTGKTTLALALSKTLIADGKTVLLISPEPYSELSAIWGVKIPMQTVLLPLDTSIPTLIITVLLSLL
jgi:CO dehydrogenase nickel-insertion accessory protein CooC1